MRIALVMFCTALFCGTSVADEKPDFTLTSEVFAKEAKDDPKAFREKYKKKVVELTATVYSVRAPFGDLLLNGYKDKPTNIGALVSVSPPKAKLDQSLRGLARGQQVTVRGKQVDAGYPSLLDCTFVKIGPSTAVPVTVSKLAAEFTKDATASNNRYDNRTVVLRAKVLTAKVDTGKEQVRWTLADPTGNGDVKIEALAGPLFGDPLKVLEKIKPGDVVVLIGEVDSYRGTPCAIAFPLILEDFPAGVKLPEAKK